MCDPAFEEDLALWQQRDFKCRRTCACLFSAAVKRVLETRALCDIHVPAKQVMLMLEKKTVICWCWKRKTVIKQPNPNWQVSLQFHRCLKHWCAAVPGSGVRYILQIHLQKYVKKKMRGDGEISELLDTFCIKCKPHEIVFKNCSGESESSKSPVKRLPWLLSPF